MRVILLALAFILTIAEGVACSVNQPDPNQDAGTCYKGNDGNPNLTCPPGYVCAFWGCVPKGVNDTGSASQASVTVETSCTGLPAPPYSNTETTPFFASTTNGHGWGVITLPPSGTTIRGIVTLAHPGAWGDACCNPPGSSCGGDNWPGTASVVDTRGGLASLGYVVFSPCYRPPSVAVWPAQISDTICAQRYFADFAAGNACAVSVCADGHACTIDADCSGHGLSTAAQSNAFGAGASSGAMLIAMAAWASFSGIEDGTCPRSGTRPSVVGVVPWSGAYDLNSLYVCSGCTVQQKAFVQNAVKTLLGFPCDSAHQAACATASPVSYVSSANPPAFVWHGALDPAIPAAQANELAAFAGDGGVGNITVDVRSGSTLHAQSMWSTSAEDFGCTVRDNFLPSPM